MKLIKKTNRNFLLIILFVLPLACMSLFFTLTFFINDEIDEKLKVDELRIVEQLKVNAQFISIAPVIEVSKLLQPSSERENIHNVFVYDPIEKEDELFRELESVKKVNGITYLIKVRHSMIEDKDFVLVILSSMGLILLIVSILLFILNKRMSLKLWSPFHHNIEQLKAYSFLDKKGLILKDSNIDEFQELKRVLLLLTKKLENDYQILKEFTENASHEIQTPLAIMSANLEEALQLNQDKESYLKIYTVYQSVQRLSKLNEKLLLLAKIENNQFFNLQEVDFNALVNNKLLEFEPLLNDKNIRIELENKVVFKSKIDVYLANIMIANLLSNALKHNVNQGYIAISFCSDSIQFSNPTDSNIDIETIFKRFKKESKSSDSSGLGLSIVKKIADVSGLNLEVSQKDLFQITIKK